MPKFLIKLTNGVLGISLLLSVAIGVLVNPVQVNAASSSIVLKQQGIQGTITVGPTSQTCGSVGSPCYIPYQTTMAVYNNGGKQVAAFTSDVNGQFRINLSTGTYTIAPIDPLGLPTAPAQTVRVSSGQYTSVSIQFDSGIR